MSMEDMKRVGKDNVIQIRREPFHERGFTKVYLGKFDDKQVVVKRLHQDKKLSLEMGLELEVLREFQHENVVRYLYKDFDDDFLYIVLEKCDSTLDQFICDKKHEMDTGNLNISTSILWQMTKGLAYLHVKDLIHRDLKPSNILLIFRDNKWVVKITDFGISKQLSNEKKKVTQSSVKGTSGYFAPETLRGEKIGQPADIFALGIVFYHVLSNGQHPYGNVDVKLDGNIWDKEVKPNLDGLKNEYVHVAQTLIMSMIEHYQEDRLQIREVQAHHLFWDAEKKLDFIQQVSDYSIAGSNFKTMSPILEKNQQEIVGDWRTKLNALSPVVKEVFKGMHNKKQTDGICGLLRNIRNLKNHYDEKPPEFRKIVGNAPNDMILFFTKLFPKFLPHIYDAVKCQKDKFDKYYTYKEIDPGSGPPTLAVELDLLCQKSDLSQGPLPEDENICLSETDCRNQQVEKQPDLKKELPTSTKTSALEGTLPSDGGDTAMPMSSSNKKAGSGLTTDIKDLAIEKSTKQKVLVLRNYQWELAEQALKGENSLIVAPTGSGKTVILTEIIRQHLAKPEGSSRVMFLVPKTALARQQSRFLESHLPKHSVKCIIGEFTASAPPGQKILDSQVTVLTPQILVNELKRKEGGNYVTFTDISMLIFDECHHATKNHPYRELSDLLLDYQIGTAVKHPIQIIGVTASPGVGKAKDKEKVKQNLIGLLSNLNVMSPPATVVKNSAELEKHHSKIKECFLQIDTEVEFGREVAQVMDELGKLAFNLIADNSDVQGNSTFGHLKNPPREKGNQPYENWIVDLMENAKYCVPNGSISAQIQTCAKHLKMYNFLIQLKDLVPNAIEYTNKTITFNPEGPGCEELKRKNEALKEKAATAKTPMADCLLRLIRDEFRVDADARCFIFVERRVAAVSLKNFISADEDLAHLNPTYFTGQSGTEATTDQKTILTAFQEGEIKVLIATSVAEEGLSFEKCSLVIMYNYVTGEVGRIQRSGRGRTEHSRSIILASVRSDHKKREEDNRSRAEATKKAIEDVKKIPEEELRRLILEAQQEHRREKKRKRKLPRNLPVVENEEPPSKWKILCQHCKNCITTGDKLRLMDKKGHKHTVIKDQDFYARVKKEEVEKQKGPDIRGLANFLCGKVACGKKVALEMEFEGKVYPVLAGKRIILMNEKGLSLRPKECKAMLPKISKAMDESDDNEMYEAAEVAENTPGETRLSDQHCLDLLEMLDDSASNNAT